MTGHITIGLCTDRWDWLSWLIRFGTWSQYSHVVIVSPDGSEIIEATHGKRVQRGTISEFLSRDKAVLRTIQHPRPFAVWLEAEKMIGAHYDDAYVWGWIFRQHWQRPKWISCVELLTIAARRAGHPIFPLDASDSISPQHFYLISEQMP